MLVSYRQCPEEVHNFLLDDDSAALVALFTVPRCVRDCLDEYSSAAIEPEPVASFLSELVESGILRTQETNCLSHKGNIRGLSIVEVG